MIEAALVAVAIATAQPGIDPALADRYAEDIAAVSPDVEMAIALVVTAWGESNFRIAIEKCDCEVWECDDGEAAGLYQLHDRWYAGHEPEEICASNRLSTELAAGAMAFWRRATGNFERAIRAFRGATSPDDPISIRRIQLYQKLLRKARTTMGTVTEQKDLDETIGPDGMQKNYLVLSEEERAKGFVRPVRRTYCHEKCGAETTMGLELAETYAREPHFYSGTFCAHCQKHLPVGPDGEFVWLDGSKVGT